MGVLYAKVAGNWVPISGTATGAPIDVGPPEGSAYVTDPAEAGPRSDYPGQARFGNISVADKTVGFVAADNGENLVISGYDKPFSLFTRDAAGTGFIRHGQFTPNATELSGWYIGASPFHGGFYCFQSRGAGAATGYTLLVSPDASTTLLNSASHLAFRIANNEVAYHNASASGFYKQVVPSYSPANMAWNHAQVLVAGGPTAETVNARIAFYQWYAPQIRQGQAWGERFHFVNDNGGNFVPITASAFETGSALATKHDVRTLRPQRERIVVRHDPFMDEVPDVDVMALRPVAFRRNGGPPNHVEVDAEPVPDPLDSSFGIQATRQRLGLIADEVQHVIPSAVSYDIDRQPMGIDYAQITVALLDHVQRLTEEVATLKYRIVELEGAQP